MPLCHVQTEKQHVSHLFTIKKKKYVKKKMWHLNAMGKYGAFNARADAWLFIWLVNTEDFTLYSSETGLFFLLVLGMT